MSCKKAAQSGILPTVMVENLSKLAINAMKFTYFCMFFSGSGPHTVGCIDLMSDHTVNGTFVRIFYPTHKTDVFVSLLPRSDIISVILELAMGTWVIK